MRNVMRKTSSLILVILSILCLYCSAETPTPPELKEIVQRATEELGKPYELGRAGPDSYDPAGLVSYCVTGIHTRIGTVYTLMSWPQVSEPMPGDICVSQDHCGIYVGAGLMIHAPMEGTVVSYGPVQRGMIFVRSPEYVVPPSTGDNTPVLLYGMIAIVSFMTILWFYRKQ